MRTYTKQSPGCYHSMIDYLSHITGKSKFIEIDYTNLSDVDRLTHNVHFVLNGEDLGQLKYIFRKGAIKVLTRVDDDSVDIPLNTRFDRIYKVIYRPIEDYGISLVKCGKYKDSLGGGWYSNVDIYTINDQYFAMMDCTCG